jgi:hypothetical protein
MTPEEQVTEIKTDLLRIHSRVLRLTGDLDRLAETIQVDSSNEEIDIFCLRPVPPAEYRDTFETETTDINVEPTPEGAPTETTTMALAPFTTPTPSPRNQISTVSARTVRQTCRHRTSIRQAQHWIDGYRERSEQRVR